MLEKNKKKRYDKWGDELKDLLEIRDEIDCVDRQIVELYQKRMQLTSEVAEYKIRTGKKVYDKEREVLKIEKLTGMVADAFSKHGIRELFEHIMTISRKRQYQLLTEHGKQEALDFQEIASLDVSEKNVVFQGVEGAYAQIAMHAFFGEDISSFHVGSWREAMQAITNGSAEYAVLPIENSTAGVVAENYDLLMEYDCYIVGEQIIPVRHCLLGLPGAALDGIKNVYSHPQALAQCDAYLQAHGNWECARENNTALAARKVKESQDRTKAAIASELTAKLYGLDILAEGIQSNRENSTRFIIVTGHKVFLEKADKISICLEIRHESGSLYHALSHIIYNDLNMDFIQSRPIRGKEGKNWQYRFFIDFQGNLKQGAVQNALLGLKEECEKVRVLGNY